MDSHHYSHHCSERIDGGDSAAAAGNEADSADAAGDSVGGGGGDSVDGGDCDRLPTAEDSAVAEDSAGG